MLIVLAPLSRVSCSDLQGFGLTMGHAEVSVSSEAADHRLRMCDLAGQLRLSPSGSPGDSTVSWRTGRP